MTAGQNHPYVNRKARSSPRGEGPAGAPLEAEGGDGPLDRHPSPSTSGPKDRICTVGAKVSGDLVRTLDSLAEEWGQSRSDMVRRALVEFVERHSSGKDNPRLTADLLPSHVRLCPCLRSSLEGGEPRVNRDSDDCTEGDVSACARRSTSRGPSTGAKEGVDDL